MSAIYRGLHIRQDEVDRLLARQLGAPVLQPVGFDLPLSFDLDLAGCPGAGTKTTDSVS